MPHEQLNKIEGADKAELREEFTSGVSTSCRSAIKKIKTLTDREPQSTVRELELTKTDKSAAGWYL